MAASGSFYLEKSAYESTNWTNMQGWVEWSESEINVATNTSRVTVNLQCVKSANYVTTGTWAYEIYINGTCVADSSWYGQIGSSWVSIATVSATVPHNTDGSKTVAVYAYIQGPSGTTLSGKSSSGTSYAMLSSIPRASTIGATDANIGSTSVIAVTKMASNYTHSIAYAFGALSGYVGLDGQVSAAEVKLSASSLSLAIPTAWYAQIPNAKSGVCTLTCKTYSGDTQIGSPTTTTFTATAAESQCVPIVSGTVTDINAATVALTGNASKLIRYMSEAKLTITATAQNSASIASKTVAGYVPVSDLVVIAAVDASSFVFAATDSRGYSTRTVVAATIVNYVRLTNNATIKRSDATSGKAVLTLSGSYFSGNFGAAANELTVKYRIKVKGGAYGGYVTASPIISAAGYSQNVELTGLTYTSEWVVEVMVSDKLMSKTIEVAIGKGIPIANWGEDFWRFNVPLQMGKSDGTANVLQSEVLGKLIQLVSGQNGAMSELFPTHFTNPSYIAAIDSNWKGGWSTLSELKTALGSISITQLWENASPTSSFAAQTIELDLSGYSHILVVGMVATTYQVQISTFASKGPVAILTGAWGDTGTTFHREFSFDASGVAFGKGYYMKSQSELGAIPYQIYGIEGVTECLH